MARGVVELQGEGLLMRDPFDKRILQPFNDNLYSYHMGIRFDPGAAAEAFNPRFELPIISFRGRARVAGALRIHQQPQLWFAQQRGVNGLGGLSAGQIISQPLLDPSAPIPDNPE